MVRLWRRSRVLRIGEVEKELRTPAAAGIAGLLFSALFITSVLLVRKGPAAGSSAQEIAVWYGKDDAKTIGIVGLYLAPFSGIAFLWFIAVIRSRIGDREDRFFSTVLFGSGILFVAMVFAAAAVAGAPLMAVKFQHAPAPSPDSIVLVRGLAYTFLYVYGVRAAGVFMIVVSTIALRTAIVPRSLAFVGYGFAAVLLFSVSFYKGIVLVFPAWVAALSIVILWTSRAASQRSAPPRDELSGTQWGAARGVGGLARNGSSARRARDTPRQALGHAPDRARRVRSGGCRRLDGAHPARCEAPCRRRRCDRRSRRRRSRDDRPRCGRRARGLRRRRIRLRRRSAQSHARIRAGGHGHTARSRRGSEATGKRCS